MYYWHYGALGRDVPQAAWHLITHPLAAARLLITPRVKLDTMAWLAGALLFLPLLSPISLAAVPLLAERMLANSAPDWWGLPYQYNAFVAVVLVCAAVDGALRLSRWIPARSRWAACRALTVLAALCCAAAVALVPFFPLGAALHPGFYRLTARDRAAAAAVAAVPPRRYGRGGQQRRPAATSRDTVLLWDWTPRWAPWVVADTGRPTFPFRSLRAQRAGSASCCITAIAWCSPGTATSSCTGPPRTGRPDGGSSGRIARTFRAPGGYRAHNGYAWLLSVYLRGESSCCTDCPPP